MKLFRFLGLIFTVIASLSFIKDTDKKKEFYYQKKLRGDIFTLEETTYSSDGKTILYNEISTFDKEHKLTRQINNGSDGTKYSQKSYLYDAKGNLLSYTVKEKDGTLTGSYAYRYDSRGNNTGFFIFDNDGKTISYYIRSIFDKNNHEIESNQFKEDTTRMAERYTYTYDKKGNLKCKTSYEDDFVSVHSNKVYTYDANGNMLSETLQEADGTIKSKEEWVYDDKNNRTEIKSFNNDLISPKRWVIWKFDNYGNEILVKYFKPGGILESAYNYGLIYDTQNNWTKKIITQNDVPTSIVERKIRYY